MMTMMDDEVMLSGPRKAAMFLIGVGDQVCAEVLRQLTADEVRRISKEIAATKLVGVEEMVSVFREFESRTTEGRLLAKGGADRARLLVEEAFGQESAQNLLGPVFDPQIPQAGPETLEEAEPAQLAMFLKGERPQTIAVVLANLPPKRAAALLSSLPEDVQLNAAMRMASLDRVSPEVFQKVAEAIGGKLKSGRQVTKADGVKAFATLLNHVDSEKAENLLFRLEEQNRTVADSIRNLFFVFEDVLKIPKDGMKILIGNVEKGVLMTALKGCRPDIQTHFTQCLSARAAEMMAEDMEAMGPVKIRDVRNAQKEVIAAVKKLQDAGTINLDSSGGGGGEQYVV